MTVKPVQDCNTSGDSGVLSMISECRTGVWKYAALMPRPENTFSMIPFIYLCSSACY